MSSPRDLEVRVVQDHVLTLLLRRRPTRRAILVGHGWRWVPTRVDTPLRDRCEVGPLRSSRASCSSGIEAGVIVRRFDRRWLLVVGGRSLLSGKARVDILIVLSPRSRVRRVRPKLSHRTGVVGWRAVVRGIPAIVLVPGRPSRHVLSAEASLAQITQRQESLTYSSPLYLLPSLVKVSGLSGPRPCWRPTIPATSESLSLICG
jgi:hypothetical protein